MIRAEWLNRAITRRSAFVAIASALGAEHPITQMMGTLAWGRHNWESGVRPKTLQNAIEEAAALDGAWYVLHLWARDHDVNAQKTMLGIWYQEL